jgi:hypothetical protein
MAAGFDIRAGLPFEMGDPRIVAASGKRAVLLGRLSRFSCPPIGRVGKRG